MSGAGTILLLIYGLSWPSVTGYLMQKVTQCTFSDNKQGNITFISAFTLNRQVVLEYSEPDEMYLTCLPNCIEQMGDVARDFAILLNSNPDTANQVKKEEERCKEQVKTYWNKTVERIVKPSIEVFSPVQVHAESLPVLVCHVWGFYPKDINVAWFKNDKLVKNYTEAERTGDWTYRIVAALDLRDSQHEDNYTCLVDHASLDTPVAKIWKHGLTNTQIIKISVASVVFALGLVCLIVGVVCWRNAKRKEDSVLDGGSVNNVSTSPLLPSSSQSLLDEDMDLGEESDTHSVQGELSVEEPSSLTTWWASPTFFYQGCALKGGDEAQANDQRCRPI